MVNGPNIFQMLLVSFSLKISSYISNPYPGEWRIPQQFATAVSLQFLCDVGLLYNNDDAYRPISIHSAQRDGVEYTTLW